MRSTDVFIIGGGPAGLAAGIAARRVGLSVIVADGAQPPIDKACGEGLMPDGVRALEALGVSLQAHEGIEFRGVRFIADDLSADATFPANSGLGVRRVALHQILIDRAQDAGVQLLWQTPVSGISSRGVHAGGAEIKARWIVGADGGRSRLRSWARLDGTGQKSFRYAFRRHYRVALWTDYTEIYWGRSCQIYIAPVTGGQICVVMVSRDRTLRLDEALKEFPALQKRLDEGEIASSDRGAATSTSRLPRVCRGNVALIGDASGTVDAITGDGLSLSFRQAVVLAECLRDGDLGRYELEHRRLARRPRLMAKLMLTLDGRRWLQRRVVQAFRKRPEIFKRLLALHVGELSTASLARNGLDLGWGLLNA